MYFSSVPSEEWPRAVDARLSSPQHPSSLGTSEEGSDGPNDGVKDARTTNVREKLWGKRPAQEEPSLKRRKCQAPLAMKRDL